MTEKACLKCHNYQGPDVSGFEYIAHTCVVFPQGIPEHVFQCDQNKADSLGCFLEKNAPSA